MEVGGVGGEVIGEKPPHFCAATRHGLDGEFEGVNDVFIPDGVGV